jgi:hypothetical protein
MYGKLTSGNTRVGVLLMAATMLLGAALATAQESAPDSALSDWLGKELTVTSSTINDHMPTGGKLTFIFDSSDNVVRICTRSVASQRAPWQMDFATPCSVTLTFTRGTRYCSIEDVKAGNAEVLSSCHRLRTRDVAMHPATVKGTVELNDMIAFLVEGADGKKWMAILVDSPARVTEGGVVIVHQ